MKVGSLEIEVELIWTSKYAAALMLKPGEIIFCLLEILESVIGHKVIS